MKLNSNLCVFRFQAANFSHLHMQDVIKFQGKVEKIISVFKVIWTCWKLTFTVHGTKKCADCFISISDI